MAFKSRSRLKSQLNTISKSFGSPSRATAQGVGDLLDASVLEVQRTDSNIRYFPVTSASPYMIPLQELIAGVNVIGVRTAGAMLIQLPLRTKEEQVIRVADERGTADSAVITVEVA